jgi:hypothetical protein
VICDHADRGSCAGVVGFDRNHWPTVPECAAEEKIRIVLDGLRGEDSVA